MMIDVIIPTYRRYEILAETLESVQAQTYPHWECWIAEDGESEKTHDTVAPFLNDKRFHYLPGKHAGTPAAPRNRAIQAGRAPFVAFLDDDDIWLPEKLERQMSFLQRHADCVLLGCNARIMRENQDYRNTELPLYFNKAPFGRVLYPKHVQDDYFINSSAIIRRAVLKFAGLQNETLHKGPDGEDYDLWLRIGTLGDMQLMPESLMVYRVSSDKQSAALPSKLQRRRDAYHARFKIYRSALQGVGLLPGPLLYPENHRERQLCQCEMEFYGAGPRLLGRLRHNIRSTANRLFYKRPSKRKMHQRAIRDFEECKSRWEKHKKAATVECIIFSRDRAMQLHGLLSTMGEKLTPSVPVHVIFMASTSLHQKAYEEVANIFFTQNVRFVLQQDAQSFKQDLMKVLYSLSCDSIFFLVDDILFTEAVDLQDVLEFDQDENVFSLRMGQNLSRCYVLQKPQPQPPLNDSQTGKVDFEKIIWQWDKGELDWGYPLSVDGHFFDRRELVTMASLITFSAPNSFEDQLQIFKPFFSNRCGVSYKKSRIVNIPCNRVQNERDNLSGNVHPDKLLAAWNEGYQIDYKKLYGFINESAHQDHFLPLILRSKEKRENDL